MLARVLTVNNEVSMSIGRHRRQFRAVGALATFALVLCASPVSTARPLGAKPIFAAQWEVAKGVQRIVLPAAPSKPAGGLIVVKVRIDANGVVVSAKTESGERDLSAVVEPALLGWRYNAFQYEGSATEVETYVCVVYEPSETRYYVQGDHCVLTGPPGSAANVRDITETDKDAPGLRRMIVDPDNDPKWWSRRVEGAENVIAGKAIHRPQPPYPESAKRAGVSGEVTTAIVGSRSGVVVYAAPISGPNALRAVSVEAARKWRFSPTTKDGKAVVVIGSITFGFARR
jgi:hypothetical protein